VLHARYGLAFGQSERKTMSMALVDRALRARELGEEVAAPAQDEEFVMSHSDNVQATGFVEHLKLPHYVDFQSELGLLRKLRQGSPKPRMLRRLCGRPRNERAGLQLRLSGRTDQTDDPPRHPERRSRFPAIRCRSPAAKCRCPMAGAPAACR